MTNDSKYYEMLGRFQYAPKVNLIGGAWDGAELSDMGESTITCWTGHLKSTYEVSSDRKTAKLISAINTLKT